MNKDLPIVVIGGGPAGSTVSTLLNRYGHQVLLLEKERFPRFHVGESLLVFSQDYWSRLNLDDALIGQGFNVKYGGEIRIGKSPDSPEYFRSEMKFVNVPRSYRRKKHFAYQVERSYFDHWLFKQATKQGVDTREEARVTEVIAGPNPEVHWRDASGMQHVTPCKFVVDASGRHAMLARKFGVFRKETLYMTSSVFSQFSGISIEKPEEASNIQVYLIQDGWVWFIPLAGGKMSVGIVMNEPQTKSWPKDPEETFRQIIGRYEYLRVRFRNAKQVMPVRIIRNLPYYTEKVHGDGWALCGDAGLFVDPIHSSGVHLAFTSATALADELNAYLAGDSMALERYAKKVQRLHNNVRNHVRLFYQLLRYHAAMYGIIRLTGDIANHWSGPWLRRVSAWSFGNYDRFTVPMRAFWGCGEIGKAVLDRVYKYYQKDPWGKHGLAAPIRPFDIPRDMEAIRNERLFAADPTQAEAMQAAMMSSAKSDDMMPAKSDDMMSPAKSDDMMPAKSDDGMMPMNMVTN